MAVPSDLRHSLPPVVDAHVRVLVLGSLPGEASLAAARYYAHPQNQFWRLMGAVIGADLVPLEYERRLQVLLATHVGLWDVVASASRTGSLDAAIRMPKANDLRALVDSLPELRAVAFNGGTSARIGGKALGTDGDFARVPLPSSSSAFTLTYESKRAEWLSLTAFLN